MDNFDSLKQGNRSLKPVRMSSMPPRVYASKRTLFFSSVRYANSVLVALNAQVEPSLMMPRTVSNGNAQVEPSLRRGSAAACRRR